MGNLSSMVAVAIKRLYDSKRLTAEQVKERVVKGTITQEDCDIILK